jgi:putative ABC transport system permease protein
MFRDVRLAARALTRSPGFTAVVVLTLALGIGAATAIYSVVSAVVFRPLDYPEPQQLVRITSELRGFGATDTGVSAAELIDYQSRSDLFDGVAGVLPISANVTGGDTPERVEMLLVSWNYFSVLGVPAAHGRMFGRDDDTPGVADVAVVSDAFWRRRLGGDPGAIGRTITIDEDPILVVGVMPSGFHHPGRTLQNEVDVWSPAGFRGAGPPSRSRRRLEEGLARLQPGVTLDQAQSRLADYGATITRQFPSDYPAQDGWRPRVVPLHDAVVGSVTTSMFVLLCGVALLLLVACVNVAHLVLARSSSRQQELAIRRALGASAGRLISQLVTENATLSVAGGALAVLVASWAVRGLIALAPSRVPRLDEITLDLNAVVVTGLISLLVTVIFSIGPVLQMRRSGMSAALKDGARAGSGRRMSRARSLLVAAEVAMATVLLVGAGLLVRTVVSMLNVPVGFETDHLLSARLTLPRPNDPARAMYLDPARRLTVYREVLHRIEALPGVERAALSSQIPLGGFNPPLFAEIESASVDAVARPVVHDFQISSGYFETMGIRLLRGRTFTEIDRAGAEPVAIVSETAARRFWNGRDPLGQRLRLSRDAPWMTVIGVVNDVLNRRLTEAPQPLLYRSVEQSSDLSMALLIRTRGATPDLGESVAREIRSVDTDLPVYSLRTMNELIDTAVAQRQFLMRMLVAFGVAATALALLGIYGVMAYAVSQRRREIGIRMAIGARQIDISRMVVQSGLLLTGSGVVAGVGASLALTQLLTSQLFGVQPSDPLTMMCVLLLMIAVSALAAYLPARRAAAIDPVAALRAE